MARIGLNSGSLFRGIPFGSSIRCRIFPSVHAVDYFMRQVGGIDGAIPRIDVPRIDTGFIAIHPYSGSPKKNWPHFADLAKGLSKPVQFCVEPRAILARQPFAMTISTNSRNGSQQPVSTSAMIQASHI